MSSKKDVLRLVEARREADRATRIGMSPLHEPAMRLANFRFARPRRKTKDLVGFLLAHGARTWRGTQPRRFVAVRAITPSGHSAVEIRFE